MRKSQLVRTLTIGTTLLGGVAAFLLLDSLLLEHLFFRIKKFKIGTASGTGEKITLVHLTDLHLTDHLVLKHSRLAKKINSINPQLLLISGDTVDERGQLKPMKNFFPLLNSNIKILAIPGNHEHKADPTLSEIRNIYQEQNGKMLMNETEVLQFGSNELAVTGMDDFIEGKADFEKAVEGIYGQKHHIVLVHSPKQQEDIRRQITALNKNRAEDEKLRIGYFMAGHNHGGQVSIGDYAPVLPTESGNYVEGWYNKGDQPKLYLSKGFGTSAIPFRFMARAEITVFEYYF